MPRILRTQENSEATEFVNVYGVSHVLTSYYIHYIPYILPIMRFVTYISRYFFKLKKKCKVSSKKCYEVFSHSTAKHLSTEYLILIMK